MPPPASRCTARDRSGRTHDALTGMGALSAAQLQHHLAPVLARDVLLVTDAHAAYRAFARTAELAHHAVNLRAGVRVRGAMHVQNVNAYHSRLRGWLHHFRGGATRYLGTLRLALGACREAPLQTPLDALSRLGQEQRAALHAVRLR